MSTFEAVNKFFGVKSDKDKKAPKSKTKTSKTQAEKDDDVRFRNKFRDGPNDKPKAKPTPSKKPNTAKQVGSTGIVAKLRDKSKKAMQDQGI